MILILILVFLLVVALISYYGFVFLCWPSWCLDLAFTIVVLEVGYFVMCLLG